MISERRIQLRAPSEWDVTLSPELAPLFVLDSAIVAAQRIFSVSLDPSSSLPGGTRYPPTRALLATMHTLRCHIREHRLAERAFADRAGRDYDQPDGEQLGGETYEESTENLPF